MLVILTEEQIISAQQVCCGCLMADRSGLPRWRQGRLCCGRTLDQAEKKQATVYECQMGFRLAEIE